MALLGALEMGFDVHDLVQYADNLDRPCALLAAIDNLPAGGIFALARTNLTTTAYPDSDSLPTHENRDRVGTGRDSAALGPSVLA